MEYEGKWGSIENRGEFGGMWMVEELENFS